MTTLSDLTERLEKATGPDRELDEAIIAWSQGAERVEDATFDHKHGYARDGFWVSIGPIHPVTESIDAALALVERVLPGFDYIIEHTNGGLTISCLLGTVDPDKRVFGATPALAILIALLRATEPSNGGTA